ncbi:MAG: glycosyltransferase family 4 protein [Gammaproteobacteria bacterium]|nr:glycosyltransferase family 4 protein [Gammaproteobacteria bacterium]
MKFAFLTNQPSYYQMHFARAMVKELGEQNFRIVFYKDTTADRKEMGWIDEYQERYIIRYAATNIEKQIAHKWIEQADVVIQGRFPVNLIKHRIRAGKLTFAAQERLWKRPPTFLRKISRFPHLYKNYFSINKPNYHFLSIGAHAAQDLLDLGVFEGRCWQYGYFIDCPNSQPKVHRTHLKLLWCGRFCEFKQPIKAIEVLAALCNRGVPVRLTMVGDGELREQAQAHSHALGVHDLITFAGWQKQVDVYKAMSDADLFLMTSHQGEGWGLVVNEAMSHGCAVVADAALGSATVLIEHAKTGLLYHDQKIKQVADQIADTPLSDIRAMGINARDNISLNWSASVAANRTVELSSLLLKGKIEEADCLFQDGVCCPVR